MTLRDRSAASDAAEKAFRDAASALSLVGGVGAVLAAFTEALRRVEAAGDEVLAALPPRAAVPVPSFDPSGALLPPVGPVPIPSFAEGASLHEAPGTAETRGPEASRAKAHATAPGASKKPRKAPRSSAARSPAKTVAAPPSRPWPFAEPPGHTVFTSTAITTGKDWIHYVSHDEDDGAWQFLPRAGVTAEEDAAAVALRLVVAADPSVAALADLPRGGCAWRDAADAPWQRLEKR